MKNRHITIFLAFLVIGFLLMSGCTGTGFSSASPPATVQPSAKDTPQGNATDLSRSPDSSKPDARITDTQVTGDKVDVTVEFTNPTADSLVMALDLSCSYEFKGNDGSSGLSTATSQASKKVPPHGRVKTTAQMTLPLDTGSTLISSSITVYTTGLMTQLD